MRYPRRLFVVFMLSVAGCKDHTEPRSFSETLPVQAGRVMPVINEVMFDPLEESDDAIPDQPEYVEIYNPGISPVDLTGWGITDRANNLRTFETTGGTMMLGAGQYAVITPEVDGIAATSRLVRYFSYLPGLVDAKIIMVKKYKTLNLNNDGDLVKLLDRNGTVIDAVSYTSLWHNPANKTTKRISLEKFNPLLLSGSPLSWGSSTDTQYGGTPGKVNSIYVPQARAEEMLRISPNPFSPNGDQRDDLLRITINLPAGSYQLAVTVYDVMGAEVRHLASGTPAGPVALLFWDGCNNAGAQAPAGIYRVTMNAAGSDGSRYSSTGSVTLAR
ncbi:MAG: hypothetical protein HGB04_02925 [Chlorobiaceae bacterium]|nr:hypothetical protein [Chlorobiaceae bacterium]